MGKQRQRQNCRRQIKRRRRTTLRLNSDRNVKAAKAVEEVAVAALVESRLLRWCQSGGAQVPILSLIVHQYVIHSFV